MTDTNTAIPGRNFPWNKRSNHGYNPREPFPIDRTDLPLQREKYISIAKYNIKQAFEGASNHDKEALIRELLEDVGFGEIVAPAKTANPLDELPTKAPSLWLQRVNRQECPADFIKREYAPWLGRGLAQAHILHLDKPLYTALYKWLRSNELPPDLDLPTRKQMNDRLLEKEEKPGLKGALSQALRNADPATRERVRLNNLTRSRARRTLEINKS